jgi:transcriptional regulator with XRE-family HTH domain
MDTRADQARLRLREEIERQKLSQREVADLLKWSQSRVAKLLTGRVEMGINDLEALCFAVGLSPVECLRDRGLEFCADMTPTELRILERLRQLSPPLRDAFVQLLDHKTHTREEPRRAAAPVKKRGARP